MELLTAREVAKMHEAVIHPDELQGLADDKSLDAVMARIENRIAYGLIEDVYELAACDGCYIAVGHVFNDANKRTAYVAMATCLGINEIRLNLDSEQIGDMIIRAARGMADEKELAAWLRDQEHC